MDFKEWEGKTIMNNVGGNSIGILFFHQFDWFEEEKDIASWRKSEGKSSNNSISYLSFYWSVCILSFDGSTDIKHLETNIHLNFCKSVTRCILRFNYRKQKVKNSSFSSVSLVQLLKGRGWGMEKKNHVSHDTISSSFHAPTYIHVYLCIKFIIISYEVKNWLPLSLRWLNAC